MLRMESDAGLRQALVHAAMARQAGEDIVVAEATSMANNSVEEVEAEVAKSKSRSRYDKRNSSEFE